MTNATVAQSQVVMTLVDTQLQRHLAALERALQLHLLRDPQLGRVLLARAAAARRQSALGIDRADRCAERREEIFDLRRPLGERIPVAGTLHERDLQARDQRRHAPRRRHRESRALRSCGCTCRCATKASRSCVVAASLKPRIFQDLLTAYAAPGSTAGIVDRDGDFVARTIDLRRARRHAGDAVRARRDPPVQSGLYSGTTYEGLKNYTAYHYARRSPAGRRTSRLPRRSIDTPTRWSFVAAGIAALGGLVSLGSSHRARAARHGRAAARGRDAATVAEDGSDRPAHRRHRARLQQSADGGHRQPRHDPHAPARGNERLQRMADNALEGGAQGREARLAAARVLAQSAHGRSVRSTSTQLLQRHERSAVAVGRPVGARRRAHRRRRALRRSATRISSSSRC